MTKLYKVIAPQLSNVPLEVVAGTSIAEVLDSCGQSSSQFIGATLNNVYKSFDNVIYKDSLLRFLTLSDFEGERIYRRTSILLLDMALSNVCGEAKLNVKFTVPQGVAFVVDGVSYAQDLSKELEIEMDKISKMSYKITYQKHLNSDAEELYKKHSLTDKLALMSSRRHLFYKLNYCHNYIGYFYGTLAPSTGWVKNLKVIKIDKSYFLWHPYSSDVEPIEQFCKSLPLYNIVSEQKNHLDNLKMGSVTDINRLIADGKSDELIKIAESLQGREFNNLADKLVHGFDKGVRIVLISGPSSSGKTTFSYKLKIHLQAIGLKPHVLSMDNYFINREDIPMDEHGIRDFERFENVDSKLLMSHLNKLTEGEEVDIPKYNFSVGERYYDGTKLSIGEDGVIFIEGIHALNPRLIETVDHSKIFKVYIAPLSSASIDNCTIFSSDDNRLVRRIVRDSNFRDYSATNTLKQWRSVRMGERVNIFPYQMCADFFFNTSLSYELNVLKPYIVELLAEVPTSEPVFAEAKRLRNLFDFITPIASSHLPSDSLIREFIGGSSFEY